MRILTLCSLMLAVTILPGCTSTVVKTSTALMRAPVRAISSIGKQPPVAKILCMWEPAEGQGLDEKPSRGFAGQIIFFTHGEAEPIKVSGTVRIYEYTNYDDGEEDPTPDHMFQFDAGAWNAHRVSGTLGHTYNVFLPYVKKDKGHAVCALRVEIEDEQGRKVSSPFTQVTLASKTSTKAASGLRRNIIQHSSTRDTDGKVTDMRTNGEGQPQQRKLESHTIKLPPRR